MRTIKFRGKDEQGEWNYGNFVQYKEDDDEEVYCIVSTARSEISAELVFVPVNKVTVGQFTGLRDKNGKEVYEGDIVDAWSAGHHSTCNVIKYVAPKFFISLINKETGETSDFWHLSPNAFGKDELLEVIGNIHDNPELLETKSPVVK